MKKSQKVVISLIFLAFISSIYCIESKASLYLNNLNFEVQINEDASMEVIETWDIDISETNTLFKTFKIDREKYSGIKDVKVSEISNGAERELTQINELMYHVTKNCYYGIKNNEGNFEIAWGVGLDNSSAKKRYKIKYKVENAITKYNDYSELYWQFIGEEFEIPASNINGTIYLPQNCKEKEDIKVWGHTEELNGTIYATDVNKIEFNLDGYNSGNFVEVRILFPTEMIYSAERIQNTSILQKVIDEETKWADAANRKRQEKQIIKFVILLLVVFIVDLLILRSIKKNKEEYKTMEEKLYPVKLEYFREMPRENATPR